MYVARFVISNDQVTDKKSITNSAPILFLRREDFKESGATFSYTYFVSYTFPTIDESLSHHYRSIKKWYTQTGKTVSDGSRTEDVICIAYYTLNQDY